MFFCSAVVGEELKFPENKTEIKTDSKFATYDAVISMLEDNSNNFDKIEFYYDKKILRDEKLSKIKGKDLSAFFVYQAQAVSDMIWAVNMACVKELEKLKEQDKKEFQIILNKLNVIRKSHANKFLQIAKEHLKNVTDISEEEKKSYIEKIKKWNENQNIFEEK